MTRCSAGIAVIYLHSPAIARQSPFWQWHSGWCVQAGKGSESLAAGGHSFPARSAFQPVPHISRGWRKKTLFGIQSVSMYLLRFQEILASFKQQRKKRASLYVPETNQCHYKSSSPVRGKHYPELSFSDCCQWFSPRMAFNVVFPVSCSPQHSALRCW